MDELYPQDVLRQRVVPVEAAPKFGVRVNSICPGGIETRMLDSPVTQSSGGRVSTREMMDGELDIMASAVLFEKASKGRTRCGDARYRSDVTCPDAAPSRMIIHLTMHSHRNGVNKRLRYDVSGFRRGVVRRIADCDPWGATVVIDVKTVTTESLQNFA